MGDGGRTRCVSASRGTLHFWTTTPQSFTIHAPSLTLLDVFHSPFAISNPAINFLTFDSTPRQCASHYKEVTNTDSTTSFPALQPFITSPTHNAPLPPRNIPPPPPIYLISPTRWSSKQMMPFISAKSPGPSTLPPPGFLPPTQYQSQDFSSGAGDHPANTGDAFNGLPPNPQASSPPSPNSNPSPHSDYRPAPACPDPHLPANPNEPDPIWPSNLYVGHSSTPQFSFENFEFIWRPSHQVQQPYPSHLFPPPPPSNSLASFTFIIMSDSGRTTRQGTRPIVAKVTLKKGEYQKLSYHNHICPF